MKFKINKELLPIKAHFFFFFAALGPILPQLNVFGRQLGVSPSAMGLVTAVLPLLWALAKPLVGYIVDFWPAHRKFVFMLLITMMSGSYCSLWFLPMPEPPDIPPPIIEYVYQLNDTIYLKKINDTPLEKYTCHWNCSNNVRFDVYLSNSTYINTIYIDDTVTSASCSFLHMDMDGVREGEVICTPKVGCNLLCYEDESLTVELNRTKRDIDHIVPEGSNIVPKENHIVPDGSHIVPDGSHIVPDGSHIVPEGSHIVPEGSHIGPNGSHIVSNGSQTADGSHISNDNHIVIDLNKNQSHDVRSKVKFPPRSNIVETIVNDNVYMTLSFWVFVVLTCVGTVAFNVANCIGDAVCFDVLGTAGSKYGAQRAWGTAGYGLTALAGGWLVDAVSDSYKDFTPAFVIALAATVIDLYSCRALTLPSLSSPDDSGKALRDVLRIPRVLVFITFAVVAGMFDSFIIYYMFWFLEEIAETTGHTAKIKLIEGVVVAAQCFLGELVFFYFSGKIIKRWGFGTTMTVSLLCYGIRMALISLVYNPWHLVFIEGIMQGPTYALCYSSIVGYAAQVAPEGYSATVQGIVAGMDDGLGFALGSLAGGQLYARLGGRDAFRVFAAVAVTAAAAHGLLFTCVSRSEQKQDSIPQEGEKMLPETYNCAIYRETVEPLKDGDR